MSFLSNKSFSVLVLVALMFTATTHAQFFSGKANSLAAEQVLIEDIPETSPDDTDTLFAESSAEEVLRPGKYLIRPAGPSGNAYLRATKRALVDAQPITTAVADHKFTLSPSDDGLWWTLRSTAHGHFLTIDESTRVRATDFPEYYEQLLGTPWESLFEIVPIESSRNAVALRSVAHGLYLRIQKGLHEFALYASKVPQPLVLEAVSK